MFELKETVSVREGNDVISKRWVGDDVVKDFWHFCYGFFFFILLKLGKYRMMRTIDDCWWLQIGNLIVSIYRKTIYDLFFCLHFYTNNVFSLCLFYFNFCFSTCLYILNNFVYIFNLFDLLCLHPQLVCCMHFGLFYFQFWFVYFPFIQSGVNLSDVKFQQIKFQRCARYSKETTFYKIKSIPKAIKKLSITRNKKPFLLRNLKHTPD